MKLGIIVAQNALKALKQPKNSVEMQNTEPARLALANATDDS